MPTKKHLIIIGAGAVLAYLYSQSAAVGATGGINNWAVFSTIYNKGYTTAGGA